MSNELQDRVKIQRVSNHRLYESGFESPEALVSYMGAMQAQNFGMAKWGIGARMPISEQMIDEAFTQGKILRTHILRPTWHLVAAEDIRWMLELTAPRLVGICHSYGKRLGLTPSTFVHTNQLVRQCLEETNEHLLRAEVGDYIHQKGLKFNNHQLTQVMFSAELDGIVCSGSLKNNQQTYALLDNIVPIFAHFNRENALYKLAKKYFQSHGPASLEDFVWWSGLVVKEAKLAIDSIRGEAQIDEFGGRKYFSFPREYRSSFQSDEIQLLPAFDEYIVAYKDRAEVLNKDHYAKVITNNGLFKPTILHNGQVIGLWKPNTNKNEISIDVTFFQNNPSLSILLELDKEIQKYRTYKMSAQ